MAKHPPKSQRSSPPPLSLSEQPPPPPSHPCSIANFAIDPHPHVPRGFEVVPHDPNVPPSCLYAYLGGVIDAYNEDLAIAFLLPVVAKEDFQELAEVLKSYFHQELGVRLNEVQPSPIGDAFVRFGSLVERERFLDRVIQFGHGYTLRFIKHDEGNHGVQIPGDEDVFPPHDGGLAHPFPPPPTRWMGMDGPNDGLVQVSGDDAVSHSAHGPSGDVVMSGASAIGEEETIVQPEDTENVQLADPVVVLQPEVVVGVYYDQFAAEVQPGAVIVPSPPLIVPPQIPLGFENVMIKEERIPGFIGPLLLPGPLVPYPASDDEEVQEIESLLPSSSTRKRRRRTMREALDVAFLRRSARLAQDDGFINNASAEAAAADNPSVYTAQHAGPSSVAPYLNIETIQGIATGYLQIQPGAVSAAALLELDEEDIDPNV
ncbi:hypothetical protein HU200_067597 [Digitaria exilis]|uniref:DUF7597 domain-containing protein n=1 Tax=Digitaria exilis TaxID=1010633 RepID=A0A834ZZE8_9POAL|nr:hypothetical protein HU200_067597 [Digitaria exilis]